MASRFILLNPGPTNVSERALGTDLGGKYVMIVGEENVVEQRYIELGPREDDGYVVTIVTDTRDARSACQVFRATDIEAGPIAVLPLPHRVPAGFHAKWIPGERLFTD